MIPYYSPNFGFFSLLRSLFIFNPEKRLIRKFRDISGKKYVLVTNSCRSAIYLTYMAMGKKGEVLTTPLTCKVAIDPILATGNKPTYSDIEKDTLLINPDLIEDKITDQTIAIQIVHLGGFCCDVEKIEKIAKKNKLPIIEDCAQGLFSSFKGVPAGKTGDVACFSLIKNAYGIGGGIFTTNDKQLFEKARMLQNELDKPSLKLIIFRIIRNIIETHRNSGFGEKIYQKLMVFRSQVKPADEKSDVLEELKLKQPSSLELKIAVGQFRKAEKLNEKRRQKGLKLLQSLKEKKLISNYQNIKGYNSSFVKFYVYHEKLKSEQHIPKLHKTSVEAKHLEQTVDSLIQERFVPDEEINKNALINYDRIHDNLVSVPITENMSEKDLDTIVDALQNL